MKAKSFLDPTNNTENERMVKEWAFICLSVSLGFMSRLPMAERNREVPCLRTEKQLVQRKQEIECRTSCSSQTIRFGLFLHWSSLAGTFYGSLPSSRRPVKQCLNDSTGERILQIIESSTSTDGEGPRKRTNL